LLVDVVTYSGERDLLLARLDILQPDVCVVVESDHTFTGRPKALTFHDDPVEGVAYVEHRSPRLSNPWENEFAQRREGMKAAQMLNLDGNDIVGFFDVDEFPNPKLIRERVDVTAWRMAKYQMSLWWYQQRELTGVSGRWGDVKDEDIATLRQRRASLPSVDAGWHYSSFLSKEDTLTKWLNFSHTELVRPNMAEWVETCWLTGRAIESGEQLFEHDNRDVHPERMWEGPDFWQRKR
jgi:hypothetical protein